MVVIHYKIMGLEQRTGGNFITILGGKFCQRVPEGTEGAITRVNKIGNTVNEKFYDSFTGKLESIQVKDGNYGKTWNFGFRDREDLYTLQLSYSNSFSTAILRQLPNVDLTQEMKVTPMVREVEGKRRSSLFINQNGVALKHAFTRDNPNGMPDMEQVTVKGELVWDDTKRMEFLHNMVNTLILPKLETIPQSATGEAVAPVVPEAGVPVNPITPVPADDINPDEIPF